MQAALTEANLEAHEFRLDFAAAIVRSFAQKRQERLNAARTLLAQSEIVERESNGVSRATGAASTSELPQARDAVLAARATSHSQTHRGANVSKG